MFNQTRSRCAKPMMGRPTGPPSGVFLKSTAGGGGAGEEFQRNSPGQRTDQKAFSRSSPYGGGVEKVRQRRLRCVHASLAQLCRWSVSRPARPPVRQCRANSLPRQRATTILNTGHLPEWEGARDPTLDAASFPPNGCTDPVEFPPVSSDPTLACRECSRLRFARCLVQPFDSRPFSFSLGW